MLETPAADAVASTGATSTDPVVVDLGKVKRKSIKALKQGRGPLADEIEDVVAQVRDGLGSAGAGQTIVPVIVLYRQKPKRKKLGSLLGI